MHQVSTKPRTGDFLGVWEVLLKNYILSGSAEERSRAFH